MHTLEEEFISKPDYKAQIHLRFFVLKKYFFTDIFYSFIFICLGIIAIKFIINNIIDFPQELVHIIIFFSFFYPILLVFLVFFPIILSKKILKDPYKYSFFSENFIIKTNKVEYKINWNAIITIEEDKKYYFLFLAKRKAYILQKENMNEEQRKYIENKKIDVL